MDTSKTGKLKFKFGLPSAVSSELGAIKDIAQKAFKKSGKKKGEKGKADSSVIFNKFASIRTSQKVLPPDINLMIEQLYTLRQKHQLAFPLLARPSLKKGITKDISASLGISNNAAKKFIAWYSFSKQYLQLHKEGAPRLDLNGNVVGCVTLEEAEQKERLLNSIWAKGKLEKPELE